MAVEVPSESHPRPFEFISSLVMDTLPPELILHLIPFFPLTSLIAARGVSTQWRSFAQIASLHPARKALLDLYLAAIVHPNFPSLVYELRPHVREFDRETYITDLKSRGCVFPDVFELWVPEWPSKAVHFWAWPGFAYDFAIDHDYYLDWGNLLSGPAVAIDTIPVPKKEGESEGKTCRGLALWGVQLWMVKLWLVVDENESINDRRAGRLLWTETDHDGRLHKTGQPMRSLNDMPFKADSLTDFLGTLDVRRDRIYDALEK